MKDVRFKQLPPMGEGEGPWQFKRLDEFLLSTPAFVYALRSFGVVPPVHVINEVLIKGKDDAGMGGGTKWKSFEINEDEYSELVENLITHPEYNIIEDKDLFGKPNYEKWFGSVLSKYAKNNRGKS